MPQANEKQETPASRQPRVVWHASRADIDRPTIAGRVEGDNHANSGLGIFCATQPRDYVPGFGAWMHEITLIDDLRCLRMSIPELSKLGRYEARTWFEAHGRRLARDHDVIDLVEIDGRVEQTIILRDEAIASSRRISAAQFEAIALPGSGAVPPRPRR